MRRYLSKAALCIFAQLALFANGVDSVIAEEFKPIEPIWSVGQDAEDGCFMYSDNGEGIFVKIGFLKYQGIRLYAMIGSYETYRLKSLERYKVAVSFDDAEPWIGYGLAIPMAPDKGALMLVFDDLRVVSDVAMRSELRIVGDQFSLINVTLKGSAVEWARTEECQIALTRATLQTADSLNNVPLLTRPR